MLFSVYYSLVIMALLLGFTAWLEIGWREIILCWQSITCSLSASESQKRCGQPLCGHGKSVMKE
ncbi:uncharacterized protein FA14DRAFT_33894 [Meira miltonrushii]|uniref:Uncharacterized protein n=1 Tax=Meira miltonrushii TaxID=1280837 RepID=A0A316VEP2_9BASI|nr:uncharacterized protein FA14DRAFT_33894 [Meira miltonrushii]PWN34773.1 hypothetical protein FA14DRAFT_33894 [Meira miltonrushii]